MDEVRGGTKEVDAVTGLQFLFLAYPDG